MNRPTVEVFDYFGKYAMMQYPSSDERKYKHVVDYRGYQIGSYLGEKPVFEIGGMPIHELFFVIDDLGDNVLPHDLPMGSYFQATALIDYFHFIKHTGDETDVWRVVNENRRISNRLGEMTVFFREIERFVKEFDASLDDADEFQKTLRNRLGEFIGTIRGWMKPAEIS